MSTQQEQPGGQGRLGKRQTDTALVGVHRCGCITAAMVEEFATPAEVRDFYRQMANTDREVHRMLIEKARAHPLFLVEECPHDPKGWG